MFIIPTPKPKRNKHGVAPKERRTDAQGIVHASLWELQCYQQLKYRQMAGEIRNLRRQVAYDLIVNGIKIGKYTPDFVYEEKIGDEWIERVADAKSAGTMTTDSKLRIKHFETLYDKTVILMLNKAWKKKPRRK